MWAATGRRANVFHISEILENTSLCGGRGSQGPLKFVRITYTTRSHLSAWKIPLASPTCLDYLEFIFLRDPCIPVSGWLSSYLKKKKKKGGSHGEIIACVKRSTEFSNPFEQSRREHRYMPGRRIIGRRCERGKTAGITLRCTLFPCVLLPRDSDPAQRRESVVKIAYFSETWKTNR